MLDTSMINSFLFRMKQDPTILMLDELAFIQNEIWKNFLISLSQDERIFSVTDTQINEGLKDYNGKKCSLNYSDGSSEEIKISYVKFQSKSDLTAFLLVWA